MLRIVRHLPGLPISDISTKPRRTSTKIGPNSFLGITSRLARKGQRYRHSQGERSCQRFVLINDSHLHAVSTPQPPRSTSPLIRISLPSK
ncbi:hypothetical protein PoB_001141700 [Plakobranchus ocellatus]|uniref:Uncharacterized protein n=1 Tax=Plakobranchus ocellatus TaxID=259542 RepID=A0AAV3YQZ8_9GAST|nr:hypothetical protein PoB_001141700 [Plakobranchus ocellatus]